MNLLLVVCLVLATVTVSFWVYSVVRVVHAYTKYEKIRRAYMALRDEEWESLK